MAKLNPMALGVAGAIISSVIMLVLGVLGNLGIYTGAVEMMTKWHVFFSLSPLGIAGGMIEAAIVTFALLYGFAWIYNRLS